MKFELIDRVIERDENSIKAVKCVSAAEEYLADHFPGFPVLPGVLMLETLVQAARLLVAQREGGSGPLVVANVRNIRYGNMVRPGQTLVVEVTLRETAPGKVEGRAGGFEFAGEGKVDGSTAVQGRFRLEPLAMFSAE